MIMLAIWNAIFNNYFNPNGWLVQGINNWLAAYQLTYNQAKTLATTIFSYQAVAGNTTVTLANNVQNPASEHFMINTLRFYNGANATLAATDWALGITDALAKQGTVTITNSGTNELISFPLTAFIPATNDSGSGYFVLPKPIMWVAQTNLSIVLNFPTAPTTSNYNIRCEIMGLKLS